jgi:hypothetical protein
MWLVAAVVWVVVFGSVGAIVAFMLGIDPTVGFAMSVVLGPLGWLTIGVMRVVMRLNANPAMGGPAQWMRSVTNSVLPADRGMNDGSWKL